jgi:hypothetical protein
MNPCVLERGVLVNQRRAGIGLYLDVDICRTPTSIDPGKRDRKGFDHRFYGEARNVLVDTAEDMRRPKMRRLGLDSLLRPFVRLGNHCQAQALSTALAARGR